jgi:hypothetical protein
MEQKTNYKYFAFISYSSKDMEWGKRVQKKLEGYKMPATLCSEHGWDRKPINPVFFAPTDIQPGGLTEELQERLRASRNLIVICSPHSAQSEWVGREIEFFHQLGRTKQIHFFIVDGLPHSGNPETECFNKVVETLGLPEILGANIHEKIFKWDWLNKERAYVQLVSKLLGVEFDAIWQRHKRLLIQKVIAWTVGVMVVLAALFYMWHSNQPVDVTIRLNETSVHNSQLPPLKDAAVMMTMDNETKTDTVHAVDETAQFTNIPSRFINNKVRVRIDCQDFLLVDTAIVLTKEATIDIQRNPDVYGKIRFRLWNPHTEQAIGNSKLEIEGHEVLSDKDGLVQLTLPLDQQRPVYKVISSVPLETDSIFMPCGEDDVILTK